MIASSTMRVQLDPDRGRPARAGPVDLALDALDQPGADRVRRDQQPLVLGGHRVAGQHVEQVRDVRADDRVGGEQAEVLVQPRGLAGGSCRCRCGRTGGCRPSPAGRPGCSLQWVLRPTRPYTTWQPASSSLRARLMLALSSKRALISTRTSTCLPASAASISASTIGESTLVRYSVCLMASTFGSAAACSRNACTRRRERVVRVVQQHVVVAQRGEDVRRRRGLDLGELDGSCAAGTAGPSARAGPVGAGPSAR